LFSLSFPHPHAFCLLSLDCLNSTLSVDDFLDWKQMQVLVRSMPDLHKTLILAKICYEDDTIDHTGERKAIVQELALATEHAPFRHKKHKIEVGGQIKPPK